MRPHLLATLALLTIPATAQADIRATYSDGSVVEINDDGAIRGNVLSEGKMLMQVGGIDYMLVDDGGETKVLDASIVNQVATALTPPIFTQMLDEIPPLMAYPAGQVTIGGRQAMGYRIDDETEIAFAISADQDLSDVGRAIAHQFRTWTMMQGPLGRLSAPLADMYASGAAVRIGNIDLVSVEIVEIDDGDFVLPGEALDWYETEAVMLRTGLIDVG